MAKKKSKHEDYFEASSSDDDDDDSSSSSDDDDSDDDSDSSSSSDDESDSDDDDSSSSDDDNESDDESDKEYEDEYDENFFKKDDPEDHKALMAMTEVERELEIENRRAIRTAKLQQFNLEQRIRQKKKKEKEAAKAKKSWWKTQVNTRSKQENFVKKSCSRQLVGKEKSARIDQECRIPFRGRNGNFVCFR